MKRCLLWLGLFLLLALPLVFLLKDLAGPAFSTELLRLIWLGRLLSESLPQWPIWMALLVVILLLAVRSLVAGPGLRRPGVRKEAGWPGPIEVLSRRIRRAGEGEYFNWDLARHLGSLTLEVLAYQERTEFEVQRERLRAGSLSMPPEVQAFLLVGLGPPFSTPQRLLSRLKRRLPAAATSSSDYTLEQVVQYLEEKLEIDHEHRSS